MNARIPFSKVVYNGNELRYVKEVLESGWLTTAGKTLELERRFREQVGATYACAVNSCTAALHLALEAIGIGPGDRVFVPTMTFAATAEVIRYLGADPVFLDVEYGTCLLTPDDPGARDRQAPGCEGGHGRALRRAGRGDGRRRARTLAFWTSAGGTEWRVVEDAAHAFPTRLRADGWSAAFGDATCFSFYANKTITTGEGGLLATDDERIFERAKVMRLHGINRDAWDRFTSEKASWEYDVIAPGFKYNLPDVAAAIGLAQLERAADLRRERQRCAAFYYEHLGDIDGIDLPVCRGPHEDHSWHLFWLVLNEKSPVDRNRFIQSMGDAGIGTSVHYKPVHRMTYYRDRYGLEASDYPAAERHWRGCVSLPIYPSLTDAELEYICDTVRGILSVPRS